jgi:hypothetical protein
VVVSVGFSPSAAFAALTQPMHTRFFLIIKTSTKNDRQGSGFAETSTDMDAKSRSFHLCRLLLIYYEGSEGLG